MSGFNRHVPIAVSCILAGPVAVTLSSPARAQESPEKAIPFVIAEGDAADSLTRFSEQSGLQILYLKEEVSGRPTRSLEGTFFAREALERLLEGTGLTYDFVNDRTVAVRRSERAASETAGPLRLAQAEDTVEEVVVRAVEFRYDEAESAFKMPLSIRDTPQSVKVITQDLLEFAGIRKFEDVYKVDASSGVSHAGDQFQRNYYRGFRQQGINAVKIDGFRMAGNFTLDLSPFDRFEIVKGATSTLYGQNSIAGTLNAISKAPTPQFGAELDLEAGGHEYYRAQGDLHGPLTEGGRLTYRLIGAYEDSHSFLDFVQSRTIALAPTLRHQAGESTVLTARMFYQRHDFTPYFGFGGQFLGTDLSDPAQLIGGNFRVPEVPHSRLGGAPWNDSDKEVTLLQGIVQHSFANDWQLRGNVQYSRMTDRIDATQLWYTDADGLTSGSMYGVDGEDQTYAAEVNLFGDVEAFGRRHTLFLGVDYAKLSSDRLGFNEDMSALGFSVLRPDYGLLPAHRGLWDYADFYQNRDERELHGITAQVLLRPVEALTVSLGARYSHDTYTTRSRYGVQEELRGQAGGLDSVAFGDAARLRESQITLQAGVTYAVRPHLNLYASYGETFEPQSGLQFDESGGHFVDPERGRAYEVGLKGEMLANRLSYSLALFDMERRNITQSDPLHPDFILPVGTQRSRGAELEFQGRIIDGLEVYGSLAKLDAEFAEGEFAGLRSANAPDFALSLFGSYQVQSGRLRGLGIGAGVVHKSGLRTFDAYWFARPVVFDLGDFTEVDARVFYDRARWRYELAATNLLDREYYSAPFESIGYGVHVNPPRQLTGRITYRF